MPRGRKLIDKTNLVFGRLTVKKLASRSPVYWECKCSCGNVVTVRSNLLGITLSCGCLQKERQLTAVRKHGQATARTPTYRSWRAMRTRCLNKKARDYPKYGGRGIKICRRWSKFEDFLADMGERPPGTTLDRYPDNNGNYEPDNCRWATDEEQNGNRSNNRFVLYEGKEYVASALARKFGVEPSVFIKRIIRGWSVADALIL